MYTLGINAAFHDPAACLVWNGSVLAAAEEERFTRIKHGKRPIPFSAYELPFHAIDYCLAQADITLSAVDHIAYSFDPFLLLPPGHESTSITLPLEPSGHPVAQEWDSPWDPLFLSHVMNAPRHLAGGAPHHLEGRFRGVHHDGPFRWHFVAHHLAHAASAYLPSPFAEAAILTLDGRGERATTGYALGRGAGIEWLGQVDNPHSLGLLYEQVTSYLGFLHSSDEYKVMALASFGRPRYLRDFQELVCVNGQGQYEIRSLQLEERFGPARRRGEPLLQRHVDVAHSLQVALEVTVIELARWLRQRSGTDALCLAGGVALNCVLNARLRDSGLFKRLWVQPAAGDAGTALGAALWVDAQQRGAAARDYTMDHAFLGPQYHDEEVERLLRWAGVPYRRPLSLVDEVADLLARDRVVGWFQGRSEFGPRALGARSILASPLHESMRERLNDIKDREDFRPVAPVVLEEEASEWFVNGDLSPFMLFVHSIRPERRELIPAAQHVDGTARIQTVNRDQHALYYDLLKRFQARTGVPVLINTSFNSRGDPIVETPRDALESFWTTPLDALAIGSFVVEKAGETG